MNSFEWNKVAGAVLGTLLFVMVIRIGTEMFFEHEEPAKPGYVVEGVVEDTHAGAAAAPVAEVIPDFGTVLPAADVAAGQAIAQRCTQCHDLSAAHAPKIGPGLYGVVNRQPGTMAGFSYSGAMKAVAEAWTYEHLFRFLKSPAAVVPGTKMSFAGLRSPEDRINLIAFLRSNAESQAPIPAPNPAAAAPAAPAEGAAPAAAPAAPTAPAATPAGH